MTASPDRAGLREALEQESVIRRQIEYYNYAIITAGTAARQVDALLTVIDSLRAALAATGDSGGPLDVELLAEALRAHMADFIQQPESFDSIELVAANVAAEYAHLPYDKADHAAREGVPEGDLG